MRIGRLVAIGLLAVPSGCSPAADDVAVASQPIVGGTTVGTCAWPSTVLAGDSCTGALVHPRLVVTAAHCVNEGITQVTFGETGNSPARTVKTTRCLASPAYNNGETSDIGFCLLAEDVVGVPLVRVMAACEASMLKVGQPVMEVGLGQNQIVSGAGDGFGTKRFLAATIASITARGQIEVSTGSQLGEYFGDSGGPIFYQMPDQTWRLIGDDCCSPNIVSGSRAARVSIYISVPAQVSWLESTSELDLTPCHDESGWNPSAECADFPTNPDQGVGSWSSLCSGQTLVTPEPTCGGVIRDGGASGGEAGASTDADAKDDLGSDAVDGVDGRGRADVRRDGEGGGVADGDRDEGRPPGDRADAATSDGSVVDAASAISAPEASSVAAGASADGGCTCHFARPTPAGAAIPSASFAALALLVRRRRRRCRQRDDHCQAE